jgi:3-phosphoshikimate 1-carboxyvinyltransferase
VVVPGDISSAAPFIAAALLSGQPLAVNACGLNPARLGFVRTLQKMGAKITLKVAGTFPEPTGQLEVNPSKLNGIRVTPEEIPAMIDEIPLLAIVAALAKGKTVISGIESLRAKESDRIESTLALLAALGVKASYAKGSLTVAGQPKFKAAGPVETFNDHRIAMAAAAASTACHGLKIKNPGCVNKSYPGFWRDFKKLFKAL